MYKVLEDDYSLVYISTATTTNTQQSLVELLQQSRKFNEEHGITGLLLYFDGHFMQLLEGERQIIEDLMVRITADERHRHVNVLEQGHIKKRQFVDWSMAFLDFSSPKVRAIPGFSTFLDSPFRPTDWLDASTRATKWLQYFKAVMMATNANILALAEVLQFDPRNPPRG